MMVVGVKMASADAGWTMRNSGRQLVGQTVRMDEMKEVALETMSLSELMYYALVGKA